MSNIEAKTIKIKIINKSNNVLDNKIGKIYHRGIRGLRQMNKYTTIKYYNKYYVIMLVSDNKPCVFSYNKLNKVLEIVPSWSMSKQCGYVGFTKNGGAYLHNYVNNHFPNGKGQLMSYDHINRIPLDNRDENLIFSSQTKQNKNRDKRTAGKINLDNLPINIQDFLNKNMPKWCYYSYYKSRDMHQLIVHGKFPYHLHLTKIEKLSKKTKKFGVKGSNKSDDELFNDIKNALIEVNKYIKKYWDMYPNMFEEYNLNFELSKNGEKLKKEYYEILEIGKKYLDYNIE